MNQDFSLEQVDFNPFATSQIEKIIRPLEVQREIWVSCALGGEAANLSYNNCYSLVLEGDLQQEFLFTAIEALVRRHESLRATFDEEGRKMIIYDYLEPEIKTYAIEDASADAQEVVLKKVLHQEVNTPFDLVNGPLLRFFLVRKNNTQYVLTVTAHHIIADGRSISFIFEDLGKLYTALLQKNGAPLPLVYSFSEYVKESEDFFNSQEALDAENYWLDKFQDASTPAELPLDFERKSAKSYSGKRLDVQLDVELVKRLKTLSASQKITLMSVLLSAFEVLLAKISSQQQWVIGVPAAGISQKSQAPMIGHCVYLLPVKSEIIPELSFADYLKIRRSELLEDYENRQFSYGRFLRKLKVKRESNQQPLIHVVFNMDRGMDQQVFFQGLQHELHSIPRDYENFDLALNVSDGQMKFQLEWAYHTSLFKEESVQKWMQEYQQILEKIVKNPEIQIAELLEISRGIQQDQENDTYRALAYPDFLKRFSAISEIHSHRTAVLFDAENISYREFDLKSNQVAAKLQELGIGRGQIVGVMLERGPEMLIAMVGILKCGAAFLPIDPSFPQERIAYMIGNSAAALIILEAENASDFSNERYILKASLFEQTSNAFSPIEISGDDLAYLLYTSGSTGTPKGVKVSHHNLINFLESMIEIFHFSSEERMFAATTVSFDIAILELFLPLAAGASVVIAAADVAKDGVKFLNQIRHYEVTFVQGTPVTWRILLASGWNYPLQIKLLCGGEPLPKDLATSLLALVGPFWNGYGPTETTVISTIKKIEDADNINIGRPIANTQIYILDERGHAVQQGIQGEIVIGGAGVTQGYHLLESLTEEKFIPNPFVTSNQRMFMTGDLGRWTATGDFVCHGRRDHQLKIRGFRVEPGEIEQILLSISEIKEAVVGTVDDVNGQKRLVAYLVIENASATLIERVALEKVLIWRKVLQEKLPDYMIPQEWIKLHELPKTSNQKIDRKLLPLAEAWGDEIKITTQEDFTLMEKLVSQIWRNVLAILEVRKADDFFEIGGHSLVSVEVMSALEKKLGISLPLNSIFKYPTLSGLAEFLSQKNLEEVNYHSLVSIKPNGEKPPLYIVHGAGSVISIYYRLAQVMDEDQPVYGFQPRGLDGEEEPHQSVEEMASYYVKCLLEQNPDGPYQLAGYSFGGYVAYEMSRQLNEMGKQVRRLILFDTPYFELDEDLSRGKSLALALGKRWAELIFSFQEPKAFWELKMRSMDRRVFALKKKMGLDVEVKEENAWTETIRRLTKNHRRIVDLYRIGKYEGDLILFRVQHRSFFVEEPKYYGWQPFVRKVHVVQVSGHHDSLFIAPEIIQEVAVKIQKVLDQSLD